MKINAEIIKKKKTPPKYLKQTERKLRGGLYDSMFNIKNKLIKDGKRWRKKENGKIKSLCARGLACWIDEKERKEKGIMKRRRIKENKPTDKYANLRRMSAEDKIAREKAVREYIDGRDLNEIVVEYAKYGITAHYIRNKVQMSRSLFNSEKKREKDRYCMIYDREILYVFRIRCFQKWKNWFMSQDSEEFPKNAAHEDDVRFYDNVQECIEGELIFFRAMIQEVQKSLELKDNKFKKGGGYNEFGKRYQRELFYLQGRYNAILEFRKNPKLKKCVS